MCHHRSNYNFWSFLLPLIQYVIRKQSYNKKICFMPKFVTFKLVTQGERGWRKTWQSVTWGMGIEKCHFASDVPFEWHLSKSSGENKSPFCSRLSKWSMAAIINYYKCDSIILWCFVRFGTTCSIQKTWKTFMEKWQF